MPRLLRHTISCRCAPGGPRVPPSRGASSVALRPHTLPRFLCRPPLGDFELDDLRHDHVSDRGEREFVHSLAPEGPYSEEPGAVDQNSPRLRHAAVQLRDDFDADHAVLLAITF